MKLDINKVKKYINLICSGFFFSTSQEEGLSPSRSLTKILLLRLTPVKWRTKY